MHRWVLISTLLLVWVPALGQTTKPSIEVVIFLGLECPVSQKYMARLNEISQRYKDVAFQAYVPEQVSNKAVKSFVNEYQSKFPIKKDVKFLQAKKFAARITPEVFVMQAGEVKYRGAIDNWFYELGHYRIETTEHYLTDALDAIQANRNPAIKETEAVGCFIQVPETTKQSHRH
ncbi:MAG: redoxin domain-containing protein [Cyclobacteriaceae bacterium]|nr:redoxin domain-containing protein [Cyclobacteriaceae bacterium]